MRVQARTQPGPMDAHSRGYTRAGSATGAAEDLFQGRLVCVLDPPSPQVFLERLMGGGRASSTKVPSSLASWFTLLSGMP